MSCHGICISPTRNRKKELIINLIFLKHLLSKSISTPLCADNGVHRIKKITSHHLFNNYLLSVYDVLGNRDSIIKTDRLFLILYHTNPLAKGLGNITLERKAPHFYEHHLDGYGDSSNALVIVMKVHAYITLRSHGGE